MSERFEGWDVRDVEKGMVRRYDRRHMRWVVVEKSRFPHRRRKEEAKQAEEGGE